MKCYNPRTSEQTHQHKAEMGGYQLGPGEDGDRKEHGGKPLFSHLKAALVFALKPYCSGK